MKMAWREIVFALLLIATVRARLQLTPLSYTKLPYDVKSTDKYKLFGQTAEESAYDPVNSMLYVIGEESQLLHIIDISNPTSPQRLLSYEFYKGDGTPRDVEVCGSEVAVSLSSPIGVLAGKVQFFHVYTRASTALRLDGYVPVGAHPDMIKFTPDCRKLLVANEGLPGKDTLSNYYDPEGSIHIITRERTGNPSERMIDFNNFNLRRDIRFVSGHIPHSLIPGVTRLSQDLEPEYIAITPDGKTAYVTLQKNNAIAVVSISSAEITAIHPLSYKMWPTIGIDASERDGGIHMRKYPLAGLLQPDTVKVLRVGRNDYLVTANEGRVTTYTSAKQNLAWTDASLSSNLVTGNKIDRVGLRNETFFADLKTASKLGHLHVSKIDGISPFTGQLEQIFGFGGRGFSIWNAKTMALVYDSGDEIEELTAQNMPNIFNSDCVNSPLYSPENLKDSVSDDLGPKINTLDVKEDNGTIYMVVGSETTGILFLYVINASSGIPVPKFQSLHRAGLTSHQWTDLYSMDQAGDAYISDIGIISREDSPTDDLLVYVVGAASGSVSIYKIEEQTEVEPEVPVG